MKIGYPDQQSNSNKRIRRVMYSRPPKVISGILSRSLKLKERRDLRIGLRLRSKRITRCPSINRSGNVPFANSLLYSGIRLRYVENGEESFSKR